jgi:anti-anti-sigma factor
VIGLDLEYHDGVPVARYRGDIDAANAARVRDALVEELGSTADHLVLDLGSTRYLDSAGVDMLFRLSERLRERRARLHAVIPPGSPLGRVAEIVALPSAAAVHESVAEAIAACATARAAHESGSS